MYVNVCVCAHVNNLVYVFMHVYICACVCVARINGYATQSSLVCHKAQSLRAPRGSPYVCL